MNDGKIVIVAGKSRSGKTVFVNESIKSKPRLLIWDIEDQYPQGKKIQSLAALIHAIKHDVQKLRFVPLASIPLALQFEFFCEAGFIMGQKCAVQGIESTIVVEETSDVTHPGKAPASWGTLIRRGLKKGISIYAISQRIAESDKTAIGNASIVHCCALALPNDIRTMSQVLRVSFDEIDSLVSDEEKGHYEYFQRNINTNVTQKGVLTFPRKNPFFLQFPLKT